MEENDNEKVNLKEGESTYIRQNVAAQMKQHLSQDPELRNQIWAWLKTQKCQVSKILT